MACLLFTNYVMYGIFGFNLSVDFNYLVGMLSGESENLAYLSFLVEEERKTFLAIATFLSVEPHELLWACVDTVMNSASDEDVLKGCREALERRFRGYILSDWASED